MKLKLNILERIMCMGVLPDKANFVTHKIIENLKIQLSFSEEETKKYKIAEKEGQITWKPTEMEKEFVFGEKATDIIQASLKQLDEKGELHRDVVSLYEKFMETFFGFMERT